ncbi:MAG: dipeptidase [Acidobacteriota bacterium]
MPSIRSPFSRRTAPSTALVAVCWVAAFSYGCQAPANDTPDAAGDAAPAVDYAARAQAMAQEMLIVDTHIDVPYRLQENDADISVRLDSGDFDAVRAKEGGLNAPFMSIYVPADYQDTGGAKEFADGLIDMVTGFETKWPELFAVARTPDDLLAHKAAGKISLPLGMENGAPIEGDLANLQHFFDRGIRYITLTHGRNNHISDSSYEPPDNRQWNGLSPFGRELVTEMNRLGVMVDVSHVSDAAFEQAIEVSAAPMIATHSSCRHFTPGFERNMSDDMIRALAENGGVIHINFGSSFLTEAANQHTRGRWAAVRAFAEENGLERDDEQVEAFGEQWLADNPYPYATLDDVVAHIDHVVQLVGVDHVGLGSDYDGVGDSLPTGLKDVSDFPNLIAALLEKGYSEADIEKILSGNLMRVWRRVDEVAAEMQSAKAAA